jgi:hypothetical protein
MKIRQGFVSNSSSSSFCIYGIFIDSMSELTGYTPQDIKDKLKQDAIDSPWFKAHPDMLPATDEEWEEYYNDECDPSDVLSDSGLEVYSMDGDGYYIGVSWSDIGDDITGRQFKDSVEEKIKKLLPTAECDTYAEEYPC